MVYVRLPQLSFYFWHDDVLKVISNGIGKFITMDRATQLKTHLVNAQICVNLDLDAQVLESLYLELKYGTWMQKFEYENMPISCELCKKKGHISNFYPKKKERR